MAGRGRQRKESFVPTPSVVQVDTGNTGCDKVRRLFAPYRVYRRAANIADFTLNFRTAVDRFTKSIEKTPCEFVAHFELRRPPKEAYFGIGRNPLRTFKNLKVMSLPIIFTTCAKRPCTVAISSYPTPSAFKVTVALVILVNLVYTF
jgi:hypothetical protein